ncbi:MAG: NAD(P)/FAD-dependent oxidoreductase [Flavimaricola sp.]|nr:NAD(P)/FAD-dependent oxidoreductase [Flavimaricola sp.]
MTGVNDFHTVVIGGGHNGLAAAVTLATKGKRVCLIERDETLGGMARTVEVAPGVQTSQIAHLLYNLNPTVLKELGIADQIKAQSVALPTVSLSPDGRHVVVDGDKVRYSDGGAHPEARAAAVLIGRLRKFAAILGQLSTKSPPKLEGGITSLATLGELAGLAKLGLNLKRLGKEEMREFLRIALSNIADVLLDELDDGPLPGALAADAVRGAFAGPRSPGTVFSLMYRLGNGGEVRLPKGGMGMLTDVMATAASEAGCDIRTNAPVTRIVVEDDRVRGVELTDGTMLTCRAVLSSAGPLQTMQMAGLANFDVEALRRMRNLRVKGTTARLTLVLSGKPAFKDLPEGLASARILIAPTVGAVERGFNPAKYGDLPTAPTLEMVCPTLSDPALTSEGRHVLSIIIDHVPQEPTGGWTDAARSALTQTAIDRIAAHAPGLPGLVQDSILMTPTDIEALTGAPGGHWHHAEMGLDQILTLRPANGAGHYSLGIRGLQLCGASAHPGGDLTGAPGRNSALHLLKETWA